MTAVAATTEKQVKKCSIAYRHSAMARQQSASMAWRKYHQQRNGGGMALIVKNIAKNISGKSVRAHGAYHSAMATLPSSPRCDARVCHLASRSRVYRTVACAALPCAYVNMRLRSCLLAPSSISHGVRIIDGLGDRSIVALTAAYMRALGAQNTSCYIIATRIT